MPCKQQYLIVQKGLRTIQVSWQYEMAEEEKRNPRSRELIWEMIELYRC